MSKSSNYNIVRFILDRKTDCLKFVQEDINSLLCPQFKVNNLFYFQLGKKNDISSDAPSEQKILLTFNISRYRRLEYNNKNVQSYKVFRKKDFNVLYEINTISKIIRFQNAGVHDKDFIIDWSIFRDTLLLSDKTDPNKLEIYKLFFGGMKEVNK